MKEDKVRFKKTITAVLDGILKRTNPLLIMNCDEDVSNVLLELETQLQGSGLLDSHSRQKPYHFVEIHNDADMLDGLLDIYLSSKVRSRNITASDLLSSQRTNEYKFHSLVNLLTKDKFIIFHIKEDILRLFFEVIKFSQNEELVNLSSFKSKSDLQYDDLVTYFFNRSTMKKNDDSKTNVALRRLFVSSLMTLSSTFLHLAFDSAKILVLMNWRTYALLNASGMEPWSKAHFQLFDISMRNLGLIPGSALIRFMKNLNLPPNLRAEIEQNCDKKYPRFGVPEGSWEGAPNPENWHKWQKYWVEQMTTFNVPILVEEKLREILRQTGESDESIDWLISELKKTKIGSFQAYRKTAELLLNQNIPGEVTSFILEIIIRGFGQNLLKSRELSDEHESIHEEEDVDQVKVAILGYVGVGKTTLLHVLRGETLPLVHDPTIGTSIKKLPPKFQNLNIVLWDLSGQSRFSILWTKMIANAKVVVIVTDSTLENVLRSKKLVSLVKEEVPHAKIIAMANKQDLPEALKPERVSEILGVPTEGISAINPTTLDDLTQIENAIIDALAQYSLVMYFRYIITTIYDDEGEMLDILQKFDSAASAQAHLDIDSLKKLEPILDMTFSRRELRRWLQLYLEKIRVTTETINSIVVGLERGIIEAQNEAKRILSDGGVPSRIIEWIISRISQQ